jgi:hypothetical protein
VNGEFRKIEMRFLAAVFFPLPILAQAEVVDSSSTGFTVTSGITQNRPYGIT